MLKEKALIIYHQVKEGVDCPDGIFAALVTKEAISSEYDVTMVGLSYGQPLKKENFYSFKKVYIVDFSLPKSTIDDLNCLGIDIVVLDHHKTAMDNYFDYYNPESALKIGENNTLEIDVPRKSPQSRGGVYCLFDMKESGASLAWKYFYPCQPCPGIISYIEDRDNWKWRLPDSKKINFAISYLRKEMGAESVYLKYRNLDVEGVREALIGMGEEIFIKRQKEIEELSTLFIYGNACVNGVVEPLKIFFGEIPRDKSSLVSDIAQYLYNKEIQPDYVVIYVEGELSVSLRSKQGTGANVSALAKQFGGGGHIHAAGFNRESIDQYPIHVK